jgi:hypothetical protein
VCLAALDCSLARVDDKAAAGGQAHQLACALSEVGDRIVDREPAGPRRAGGILLGGSTVCVSRSKLFATAIATGRASIGRYKTGKDVGAAHKIPIKMDKALPVCTENFIRIDDAPESPKLAE